MLYIHNLIHTISINYYIETKTGEMMIKQVFTRLNLILFYQPAITGNDK